MCRVLICDVDLATGGPCQPEAEGTDAEEEAE
jgi:hypothetical protein